MEFPRKNAEPTPDSNIYLIFLRQGFAESEKSPTFAVLFTKKREFIKLCRPYNNW